MTGKLLYGRNLAFMTKKLSTSEVGNFCATLPDFAAEREAFLKCKRTPRDLLEDCIARIEAAENTVQAFAHLDLDGARSAADRSTERYRAGTPLSPIDGMPIGVKDIIDTRDMPTQMNNAIDELLLHNWKQAITNKV